MVTLKHLNSNLLIYLFINVLVHSQTNSQKSHSENIKVKIAQIIKRTNKKKVKSPHLILYDDVSVLKAFLGHWNCYRFAYFLYQVLTPTNNSTYKEHMNT